MIRTPSHTATAANATPRAGRSMLMSQLYAGWRRVVKIESDRMANWDSPSRLPAVNWRHVAPCKHEPRYDGRHAAESQALDSAVATNVRRDPGAASHWRGAVSLADVSSGAAGDSDD